MRERKKDQSPVGRKEHKEGSVEDILRGFNVYFGVWPYEISNFLIFLLLERCHEFGFVIPVMKLVA